jgi:type VI secretion system secreted protein VgrG
VELVPGLWKLSQTRGCRIFQDMTTRDIVDRVLDGAGLTAQATRWHLTRALAPRPYCVQYRESDLDFVSRLLEEDGIYYSFEHGASDHTLVLADDVAGCPPVDGADTLCFRPASGQLESAEHVRELTLSRVVCADRVVLRDHDFERPSLDLTTEGRGGPRGLEVYDYPGRYVDPEHGRRLAQVHADALTALRVSANGTSTAPRLLPGRTFGLSDHPRADANVRRLIVAVEHEGVHPQALSPEAAGDGTSRTGYHNRFVAIPAEVPYRPSRVTPRPRVGGPQSAMVVGPSREEIHTDAHGRVKVHFHWDREGRRDEHSSCWIRVSQLWAGSGFGAMFVPRVGQEVLVDFLEGDPDRPIVVGRVYNGENTTPYRLPEDKTRSTIMSRSTPGGDGYNELRFEDRKGEEEIYLHGQKDWDIVIEHDKSQRIGHDETADVGHDRCRHVGHDEQVDVGHDERRSVANNRTAAVGADETLQVGRNQTETIGGNQVQTVARAKAESIGMAKALSVGAAYQVSVGANMNETVGGAKTEEVGGYRLEAVAGRKDETIGGNRALSVGGRLTMDVTESATWNAKSVTIRAQDEIVLITGSARIAMKKNGDIQIRGRNIDVKGSGQVVVKGTRIVEN